MSTMPVTSPVAAPARPRRRSAPGSGGRARTGAGPRSTRTLALAPPPDTAPLVGRRAPFVVLVLVLIGVGLVSLLVLNTAIAADSFTRRALSQDVERLTLHEQELQLAVAAAQAPAALARAAAAQGMIPAGAPAYLVVHPDGTTEVVGAAKPAARPAPPPGSLPVDPAAPVDPPPAGGNG